MRRKATVNGCLTALRALSIQSGEHLNQSEARRRVLFPRNVVYPKQSAYWTNLGTKEVNMLQPMHLVNERTTSYATVADFFETFTDEMHGLNLLSLLLTADKDKAEKCLVCAMGECVEGIVVFMEWVHLWARRVVIKYAIQMIRPVPEHPDSLPFIPLKGGATRAENSPFAAIVALGVFERFVFVMSVLEGQSEQECAILLRCSRRDVMIARVLALTRLANTDADYAHAGGVMQA
jgi:hypothetical protein